MPSGEVTCWVDAAQRPNTRSSANRARRIAANIAKLPGIAAKLANKHLDVCVRRAESVLPPGD